MPPVRDKARVDTRNKKRETTWGLRRVQVALPVWPANQRRHSPGETSVRGPIVA